MCGIVGILKKNEVHPDFIKNCCEILYHRGPDHTGVFTDNNIGLGMTRLSIIDLTTGDQPLYSSDKNTVIVFNGEIYNYKELRTKLLNEFNFQTQSDTEVILNGYLKWGIEVFNKLNGIFSLALWDKKRKKLIIARDSLGVKPLYYYHSNEMFMFASEIKVFTQLNIVNTVSIEALNQFLLTGYVFHPSSIIKGVQQLSPGHFLEINEDLQGNIKEFKNLVNQKKYNHLSQSDWTDKINEKLKEAIIRQTVSDVPVGLMLSSGLDSMYILETFKSFNLTKDLKTFTVFFDNQSYSEHDYVQRVIKDYGIKGEQLLLSEDIVKENIESMCYYLDNLEFLPTSIAVFFLSQYIGKYIKVVLAGNGGDELFFGYPTYIATKMVSNLGMLTKLKFLLYPFLSVLPSNDNYLSFKEKLTRFYNVCNEQPEVAHVLWRHIFLFDEIKKLLPFQHGQLKKKDIIAPQIIYYKDAQQLGYKNMDKYMFIDMKTWLVDCTLKMWDKAGMSGSLEIRVPFLDTDFMDWYLQIPSVVRTIHPGEKYLFRKVCQNILPSYILTKPKQGFQVPIKNWLKTGLKNAFMEYTDNLPGELFSKSYINKLWSDFLSDKNDNSLKLWLLGCLSVWSKQHKASWAA